MNEKNPALQVFLDARKPECTCTHIVLGAQDAANNYEYGQLPLQEELNRFAELQRDCPGAKAFGCGSKPPGESEDEAVKKICQNPIGKEKLVSRCGRIGLGIIDE